MDSNSVIESNICLRVVLANSGEHLRGESPQSLKKIKLKETTGREEGGGIGMGNTCKSMLIHVTVWQKPLQYCKVISLQLIKIN